MERSKTTVQLLAQLDALSGGKLLRKDDLGILLDATSVNNLVPILDDLAFNAKFISQTSRIMQRIGKDGEGYDKLTKEFTGSVTKARQLLERIVQSLATPERVHIAGTYLAMSPESMRSLLELCQDLAWYKNWLIDGRDRPNEKLSP